MNRRLTGFSPIVRNTVWNRAEGCCEICGTSLHYRGGQYHHRRPRAAGSSRRADTNEPANCLLLGDSFDCGCHDQIESERTKAREIGQLISNFDKRSPSAVPVLLHDGWHLLSDSGDRYSTPEPAGGKVA